MMKTGVATFGLDTGKCPRWLFERMEKLAGIMSEIIIEEFGEDEFLKRLADPIWFQSFGCALAFDWNSSGLTVTTTAALKEALRKRNLGIYICGGKGRTSRKTPDEILTLSEKIGIDPEKYVRISKLVAKVDNSLIQDGFNIYHHSFILTQKGSWAVIQQGMNTNLGLARRYHWYRSDANLCEPKRELMQTLVDKSGENLTEEPHSGIVSDKIFDKVLNLTSKQSNQNKKGIINLLNEENKLIKEMDLIFRKNNYKSLFLPSVEFKYHPVIEEKFDINRLKKSITKAQFLKPKTIDELLLFEGIGPRTIRALSLVSELIYGAKPSYQDPARYTFTHGGKDGTPYPVDRQTYDEVINFFNKAIKIIKQSKISFYNVHFRGY
mgnify:CR=1 FL=1